MVNFHNPAVLSHDLLTFVKLNHTLGGLYIWEFFTTLDYEWHIIRGRIRYRWTTWIYSITRLATLIAVIMNIIDLNLPTPTNCQVGIILTFLFSSSTLALSHLLIILRIIAIWNWNKGIMGFAAIIWVTNVLFMIHGALQIHSSWIPVQNICGVPDLGRIVASFISYFINNIVLLAIMLVGLFRLHSRSAGTCGLILLLWKQGLVWFLLATGAGLPPLVLVFLNLNEAFDLMFLIPLVTTISIAGTRMHYSLANYGNSTDVMMDPGPPRPRKGYSVPSSKLNYDVPTSPKRGKVTMHTAHKNVVTSLTNENVVCISGDGRDRPGQRQPRHDNPDGLSFDDDTEHGV